VDVQVNVLGPLALFQASYQLLKTSSEPKFMIVSSAAGSVQLGTTFPIKVTAYGVSKAGVNWLAAKLYHEYPEIGGSSAPVPEMTERRMLIVRGQLPCPSIPAQWRPT